jgi:hypothetical protein
VRLPPMVGARVRDRDGNEGTVTAEAVLSLVTVRRDDGSVYSYWETELVVTEEDKGAGQKG